MTYRHISQELGIAVSTVARLLKRLGLNRLANLEPAPPVVRYQFEHPGDLLHLDIKKLGRFHQPGHRVTGDRSQTSNGAGCEFVHVAIDDASRIAFTSLTAMSAPGALAGPCSRHCAITVAWGSDSPG